MAVKPENTSLMEALKDSRRLGTLQNHGSAARAILIEDLRAGKDPDPHHLAGLVRSLILEVEEEAKLARKARKSQPGMTLDQMTGERIRLQKSLEGSEELNHIYAVANSRRRIEARITTLDRMIAQETEGL